MDDRLAKLTPLTPNSNRINTINDLNRRKYEERNRGVQALIPPSSLNQISILNSPWMQNCV